MTSTLKCINCNMVIDEMLAYVQNKISIIDEDSLVRICVATFTSEQIKESYSLLFESIPSDKRKAVRKGQGKENRILNDIIHLFKVTDLDVMPVFVARNLEMLPPITFDHLDVSKLLKDLTWMQAEIKTMKDTYATLEHLENFKKEFQDAKFSPSSFSSSQVNTKRGGNIESDPIDLSDSHIMQDPEVCKSSCAGIEEFSQTEKKQNNVNISFSEVVAESVSSKKVASSSRGSPEAPLNLTSLRSTDKETSEQLCGSANTRKQMPAVTTLAMSEKNETENEWKIVQYKSKSKNRLVGKIGTSTEQGNFKSADRKIPIFITNVHKETLENDITSYICNRTSETVQLEKISITRETGYDAYKFFVSERKIGMFLNNDLWPQGIIFRRFVNFKPKNVNRARSSVNGAK